MSHLSGAHGAPPKHVRSAVRAAAKVPVLAERYVHETYGVCNAMKTSFWRRNLTDDSTFDAESETCIFGLCIGLLLLGNRYLYIL